MTGKNKMNKAQQQYLKSKILTATPAELTLLLYNGIIQFSNQAITAISKKDYEKAHYNIQRAERIIEELVNTLDDKYEVAQDFSRIYTYVLKRLLEANIKKDPKILRECITHIRSLRDTWVQVMEKNKK